MLGEDFELASLSDGLEGDLDLDDEELFKLVKSI